MNLWIPKAIVLIASIVMIAIRAPHGQRSRAVKVIDNRRGKLEFGLLSLAWIGFFVPLVWIFSELFDFAEFSLRLEALIAGTMLYSLGLWMFYRSHKDLGTNWSITLEMREQHQLITTGIYQHIRHPMYSALLLFSLGQMLVIPNWIAGPSYLVVLGILIAFRLRAEESMMRAHFGQAYSQYAARTKRLVPGIW